MTVEQVQDKLTDLLDLLKQERKAAIELNMQELERVVACKQQLLSGFDPQPAEAEGLDDLIREVDSENRRNAYLIWSGLGWVREMMGFFGRSTAQATYGLKGQPQTSQAEGRLLSGKV